MELQQAIDDFLINTERHYKSPSVEVCTTLLKKHPSIINTVSTYIKKCTFYCYIFR